jgi:hypothetical protein
VATVVIHTKYLTYIDHREHTGGREHDFTAHGDRRRTPWAWSGKIGWRVAGPSVAEL